MSNLGQAALIVVGTVVGAYFGYPQLGFVLGSLAGSALFPTQLPAGPRIADNRTTTSIVGSPVPIVFGTANVSGTVIDLLPLVETSQQQGSKGGPVQQTFSYTQTIAIGLCERIDDDAPDSEGAIQGILRIWENGSIVYDIRPQQLANSDLGWIAETDEAYADRLRASAVYATTFELYLGDELQVADPTLEAYHGVGNVPGYRGLAYVVYPNRQLQIAQGLRHPNFQFEVFAGLGHCDDASLVSNDYLAPWDVALADPRTAGGSYVYNYINNPTYPTRNTLEEAFGDAAGAGNPLQPTIYGNADVAGAIGPSSYGGWTFDPRDAQRYLQFNSEPDPPVFLDLAESACTYVTGRPSGFWWSYIKPSTPNSTGPHGVWIWPVPEDTGLFNCALPAAPAIKCIFDTPIEVFRYPGAPINPCLDLPDAPFPGYCVGLDGSYIQKTEWVLDDSHAHVYICLQATRIAGSPAQYTSKPLNPTMRNDDPRNTEAFWVAAYNAAVIAGDMGAGLSYPTDYPTDVNSTSPNYAWVMTMTTCVGHNARVSDIIAAICKRSGLTAIDVTEMDATTVEGYAIASVCTGSAVLTPLRSVAFFDAVESNGVLKFAARGNPVVATLTADDLGAYDAAAAGATVPPSMTVARAQDQDLPRSIRFHYISTDRDYEDGEQDSPFRLTTTTTNDVDITVAICLHDVQAARCASVLWADAWASRNAYSTAVDQSWLALDAADCIAAPVDSVLQRLRIASDTNASAVLRKLSLVGDDQGAYISFAVASVPQRIPQVLTFVPDTDCLLLDLPCLRDADSDPGFYVAGRRADGGGAGWKGFTLFKSIDGGTTYSSALTLATEATTGMLVSAVPASAPYTWDDVTELTVNVPSSAYSFESRTEDAVLAGANAAAMGADQRWEIVQFAHAEQLSPTQWRLSRLLRGRRGTEHVIGSSQAGDLVVMISTGDLGRVILQASEIGALRNYKAVSLGLSFASGVDQSFTGRAEALVPFSPVDLRAETLTDGDVRLSWIRRSRLGRVLMSGIDIPLGEATESFQVDVLAEASPHTVLRTLSTSTEQVVYPHAAAVADFGSPVPSTLRVAIYQLSAIVGRGTPALETLTLT